MNMTVKTVQIHNQCVCGYNEVYQADFSVTWKDLAKSGIKRRKCKTSGKPFLFSKVEIKECKGHD